MRTLVLTLILTVFWKIVYAQDGYDPAPPVIIPVPPKPPKPLPPLPPDDKSKLITLDNYPSGKFRNLKSQIFCNMLVNEIDNIMKRNDKIISINIKGFADGLPNPGLDFSNENIYSECSRYLDVSKKNVNDEQLAILRACEIEGQLKSLLSSKSYLIFVSFSNAFFDIKDGGSSGDKYRKVEVLITFLNRKI